MSDVKNSKVGKFSRDGMTGFLRRAFPLGTANHVSAVTGIPVSTVDKWLRGISAPCPDHLGVMFAAFGPQFMSESFPVARPWLQEARCHDRIEAAIAELSAAVQSLERA